MTPNKIKSEYQKKKDANKKARARARAKANAKANAEIKARAKAGLLTPFEEKIFGQFEQMEREKWEEKRARKG